MAAGRLTRSPGVPGLPGRLSCMRFLHTADWHVGKPLRGRSRMDEFAAALDEVARIARRRARRRRAARGRRVRLARAAAGGREARLRLPRPPPAGAHRLRRHRGQPRPPEASWPRWRRSSRACASTSAPRCGRPDQGGVVALAEPRRQGRGADRRAPLRARAQGRGRLPRSWARSTAGTRPTRAASSRCSSYLTRGLHAETVNLAARAPADRRGARGHRRAAAPPRRRSTASTRSSFPRTSSTSASATSTGRRSSWPRRGRSTPARSWSSTSASWSRTSACVIVDAKPGRAAAIESVPLHGGPAAARRAAGRFAELADTGAGSVGDDYLRVARGGRGARARAGRAGAGAAAERRSTSTLDYPRRRRSRTHGHSRRAPCSPARALRATSTSGRTALDPARELAKLFQDALRGGPRVRPLRLEIEGFTSFQEQLSLDFVGARPVRDHRRRPAPASRR